jgi:dihydropteroate synthase
MLHNLLQNSDKPLLMGVLNLTPDSFSDGGMYLDANMASQRVKELFTDGCDFIDIGAESTRPGGNLIQEALELERLETLFNNINLESFAFSLDTRRASVVKKFKERGLILINDVSGISDSEIYDLLVENDQFTCVINHHRGIPPNPNFQKHNADRIAIEVENFFNERLDKAEKKGLKKERFVLDVGLGFGKNKEENLALVHSLGRFKEIFGLPLLVGISRKRTIKELWPDFEPDSGSLALATLAVANGADIIRCHNIKLHKPLKEVFKLKKYLKNT